MTRERKLRRYAMKRRVRHNASLSQLAKRRVEVKRNVAKVVTEASTAFMDACCYVPYETMLEASSTWSTRVCEAFLVARVGIEGVEGLRVIQKLIPKQFGTQRSHFGSNIMTSFTGEVFTEAECDALLLFIEKRCPTFCNSSESERLKALSHSKGASYSEFLAPPVSDCILTECRGRGRPLTMPHSPITVTVFGLNGPRRATKVSLRCSSCSTIYNYAQYGHKQTTGEKWYEFKRDLIEVSDSVYCERALHELFCCLR